MANGLRTARRVVDFGKHDPMLRACASRRRKRSSARPTSAPSCLPTYSTTTRWKGRRRPRRRMRLDIPRCRATSSVKPIRTRQQGCFDRRGVPADAWRRCDRDPACTRLIEPVLYFKGFHAIQTHRLAHGCGAGRKDFALYLQSRSSEVFQTDIHPAAHDRQGHFPRPCDRRSSSARRRSIEDDVSMLQDVTLGGTGKEAGDRHPENPPRRADRRRRQDPRQYRGRPLRARRRGLGRARAGAEQQDGRGRAGARRRGGRMRRAGAQHGPDLSPINWTFDASPRLFWQGERYHV